MNSPETRLAGMAAAGFSEPITERLIIFPLGAALFGAIALGHSADRAELFLVKSSRIGKIKRKENQKR